MAIIIIITHKKMSIVLDMTIVKDMPIVKEMTIRWIGVNHSIISCHLKGRNNRIIIIIIIILIILIIIIIIITIIKLRMNIN